MSRAAPAGQDHVAAASPVGTIHRPGVISVAIPSEHGGWGLTIEPVLLGLLLAPSTPGALIGLAAVLAFMARTPIKLVLVDRHRDRWLDRSRLAAVVASAETLAIVGLSAAATWLAGWSWWLPVLVASPLIGTELWYDARSRSRRLVPELFGAVGVAASVASIALAGGAGTRLAAGAWFVLGARAVGSIPFVRAQILRLRRGELATRSTDIAQLASATLGAAAVALDTRLAVGCGAVVALALFQTVRARTTPTSARSLGFTQMGLGFSLVVATAIGVALS